MNAPVLHVLAGPNGAGKSTFVYEALGPVTHLEFINADEIAAQRWPGEEQQRAYDAALAAADARDAALAERRSFIAETVFSHPSKLDLVQRALAAGYVVEMHVILIPADAAVERVRARVARGGHAVPDQKVRERYQRLWPLVGGAALIAHAASFYDNTEAGSPFRLVAAYRRGRPELVNWPAWTPEDLRAALP